MKNTRICVGKHTLTIYNLKNILTAHSVFQLLYLLLHLFRFEYL